MGLGWGLKLVKTVCDLLKLIKSVLHVCLKGSKTTWGGGGGGVKMNIHALTVLCVFSCETYC